MVLTKIGIQAWAHTHYNGYNREKILLGEMLQAAQHTSSLSCLSLLLPPPLLFSLAYLLSFFPPCFTVSLFLFPKKYSTTQLLTSFFLPFHSLCLSHTFQHYFPLSPPLFISSILLFQPSFSFLALVLLFFLFFLLSPLIRSVPLFFPSFFPLLFLVLSFFDLLFHTYCHILHINPFPPPLFSPPPSFLSVLPCFLFCHFPQYFFLLPFPSFLSVWCVSFSTFRCIHMCLCVCTCDIYTYVFLHIFCARTD